MPCREREETKKSRTHDGCGAISTNAGSFAIYLYDKRNGKAFLFC